MWKTEERYTRSSGRSRLNWGILDEWARTSPVENDRIAYHSLSSTINTSGYAAHVYAERYHGLWRSWSARNAGTPAAAAMYTNHPGTANIGGSIRAIRIFAYGNNTNLIPAGTTIEIYGVREDG